MINEQDKQRIEKEIDELLQIYLPDEYYEDIRHNLVNAIFQYRTAELERSEKLLQEYKEVIRELLPIAEQMAKMPMQQYHFIKEFTRTEVEAAIQKAK